MSRELAKADLQKEVPDVDLDRVSGDAFLPYPKSTLSPRIVPNDLTSFRSRSVSQVEKETAAKLAELTAEYYRVIDEFNWNKLIYESRFGFEPVIGRRYHLYRDAPGPGFHLSMIPPAEWSRPFVGTFELGANGKWRLVETSPDCDLQTLLRQVYPNQADR